MERKEITPPQNISTGYRAFTVVFLLVFSLLFCGFMISMDKPWEIPAKNDWFEWLRYSILSVMNIGVLAVFALANFIVMRAGFKKVDDAPPADDAKTTRKIYYTIVAFGIVVLKIMLMVLFGVAGSMRDTLREDPKAILPWIVIAFFTFICVCMFLIFRFVLRKFKLAGKSLSNGETDICKGKVISKDRYSDDGHLKRAGEIYSYSFTLDNGRKYENVQPWFFDQVEVGKKVEVHAIPHVGEITRIFLP